MSPPAPAASHPGEGAGTDCLWLVRWPPYAPLVSGDAVYSRSLLEALARRMPVHGLAFPTPGQTIPERPGVTWTLTTDREASRLSSLASALPSVAHRHNRSDFIRAAIRLAGGAKAVVLDLGLSFCADIIARALPPERRPPMVIINHNDEADLRKGLAGSARNPLMRLSLGWDGWKAGRMESAANRVADGYTAITTTDLASFQARAPEGRGLLLMPGYSGPVLEQRTIDEQTPMRICILGGRGSFHKQVVLLQVLRALQAVGAEKRAIIDVVGRGGDGGKLAASFPGFHFLGFIDDLESYFRTVRLGLIPDLVGGGFKMRALTHIFLRTPMLALDSAVAGMGLRSGLDYIGRETLAGVAAAAPEVVRDLALLNRIQDTAFEHWRSRFDWDERGEALHRFIQSLGDQRRPG